MQATPLFVITASLVLGFLGTVGKLLFDDWRVRQAMRRSAVREAMKNHDREPPLL